MYVISLPLLGILLAQTGVQNSQLIYILAFTITMLSAIVLFRLFSGTLLLELRNDTIKWIRYRNQFIVRLSLKRLF